MVGARDTEVTRSASMAAITAVVSNRGAQDHGSTPQVVVDHVVGGDVEQREREEVHLVVGHRAGHGGVERSGDQAPVGEHRALGPTGGPRGVEQPRHVGVVDSGRVFGRCGHQIGDAATAPWVLSSRQIRCRSEGRSSPARRSRCSAVPMSTRASHRCSMSASSAVVWRVLPWARADPSGARRRGRSRRPPCSRRRLPPVRRARPCDRAVPSPATSRRISAKLQRRPSATRAVPGVPPQPRCR